MKKIVFIPNKGARLGHQFVEWLRGYIFCRDRNIEFYHHRFLGNSENKDTILNLSYGERLFENYSGNLIKRDQMSIEEYVVGDKEDLYVYDFFHFPTKFIDLGEISEDVRSTLRKKYFLINENIPHDSISVHIRRDDIFKNSPNWANRYIEIDYFIKVLKDLYDKYPEYEVKIFSSNVDSDFCKIKEIPFKNISFHINEDIKSTLNHMINSKILVGSSSGLTFIATLISNDIHMKMCPNNFWHKWPKECIINNHEL